MAGLDLSPTHRHARMFPCVYLTLVEKQVVLSACADVGRGGEQVAHVLRESMLAFHILRGLLLVKEIFM